MSNDPERRQRKRANRASGAQTATAAEPADIGLVEYRRRNADRHGQYAVPIFVVGSADDTVKKIVLGGGRRDGKIAARIITDRL